MLDSTEVNQTLTEQVPQAAMAVRMLLPQLCIHGSLLDIAAPHFQLPKGAICFTASSAGLLKLSSLSNCVKPTDFGLQMIQSYS